MKLLNVGCGFNRLPEPFINIDSLKSQFPEGSLELEQLNAVKNYVDCDLREGLPFEDCSVDGILASHFLEHLDLQEAWKFVAECYRVLKIDGVMLSSVPDTSYFRQVNHLDTKEKSGELFGEQMDEGNPHTSFFDCALFFDEHKQALTEDSLWAILRKGGFTEISTTHTGNVANMLRDRLNRPIFSLTLWGVKK